jgi:hypothetical protein
MKKLISVMLIAVFALSLLFAYGNRCYSCQGTGTKLCTMCNGSGCGMKCYTCNGIGITIKECSACRGHGYSFGNRCYQCNGTGIKQEQCYSCKGTGCSSHCFTCGGKGYVICNMCNGRGED